jgi:hypothetical protein
VHRRCSLSCGKIGIRRRVFEITGRESHGNNAQPVNGGRCCDRCNAERVLPARIEGVAVYGLDDLSPSDLHRIVGDAVGE